MTLRWGLIKPEQFTITKQALAELERDMIPFANLSSGEMMERNALSSASDEYPVTWAIYRFPSDSICGRLKHARRTPGHSNFGCFLLFVDPLVGIQTLD